LILPTGLFPVSMSNHDEKVNPAHIEQGSKQC